MRADINYGVTRRLGVATAQAVGKFSSGQGVMRFEKPLYGQAMETARE